MLSIFNASTGETLFWDTKEHFENNKLEDALFIQHIYVSFQHTKLLMHI